MEGEMEWALGELGNGSELKITECSARGPEASSPLPVTAAPENPMSLASRDTCTCMRVSIHI